MTYCSGGPYFNWKPKTCEYCGAEIRGIDYISGARNRRIRVENCEKNPKNKKEGIQT
jgi:hypothetical protein